MNSETEPKVQQSTNFSLYDEVTNKIIAMLDNGVIPWRRPWNTYGFGLTPY